MKKLKTIKIVCTILLLLLAGWYCIETMCHVITSYGATQIMIEQIMQNGKLKVIISLALIIVVWLPWQKLITHNKQPNA